MTNIAVKKQIIIGGGLAVEVLSVEEGKVRVKTVAKGRILGHETINLPGTTVDLPTIQPIDEDIIDFALKNGADFIGLSFTRSADDVEECREILGPRGSQIKIIAKIECQEGIKHFDEILKVRNLL